MVPLPVGQVSDTKWQAMSDKELCKQGGQHDASVAARCTHEAKNQDGTVSLGHCVRKQGDPLDLRDVEVGRHVDKVRAHVPAQRGIDSETAAVHHLGFVALGESSKKSISIPKGRLCVVTPARLPWGDVGLIHASNLLGVVDSQGADHKFKL